MHTALQDFPLQEQIDALCIDIEEVGLLDAEGEGWSRVSELPGPGLTPARRWIPTFVGPSPSSSEL